MRSGLFSWVRPSDFKKIVAITLVVVLIIVAMVQLTSKGKRQKKVSALSTKQEPSQREMPTAKTTTAKYAALKEQNSQKAIVPRPPLSDILRLTIFAQEDVWIQLTQDGRVVFKGSLKKLSSETWQAKESFELRTNNAGALNLELNGKILSPLGRKGQLLRKVAITKEGLKVE